MMADAGFTYGPAREYPLAATAWSLGGLTLEHVRLAHVFVNVAGLLCIFAAMRRVCAGQVHAPAARPRPPRHALRRSDRSSSTRSRTRSAGPTRAAPALATLAVVVARRDRIDDPRRARRSLLAAGALGLLRPLQPRLRRPCGARRRWSASRPRRSCADRTCRGACARAHALRGAAVYGAAVAAGASWGRSSSCTRPGARRSPCCGATAGRSGLLRSAPFLGESWDYGDALDSLALCAAARDDAAIVSRVLDHLVGPGTGASSASCTSRRRWCCVASSGERR